MTDDQIDRMIANALARGKDNPVLEPGNDDVTKLELIAKLTCGYRPSPCPDPDELEREKGAESFTAQKLIAAVEVRSVEKFRAATLSIIADRHIYAPLNEYDRGYVACAELIEEMAKKLEAP